MLISVRRFGWLAGGLLVVSCTTVLLPSLSRARSLGIPAAGSAVTVHERRIIGSYDIAVLSSQRGDALLTWLGENDFRLDPSAQPVIHDYAQQGWSFAAARLRRDESSSQPATPHPLAFQFETSKPVYPLRLTGIGNRQPCRIELYVFGPQQAEVPGFHVKACRRPVYYPGEAYPRSNQHEAPELRIVHAQLRHLAPDATVATHLIASLAPEQMHQDAYLSWVPFQEAEHVLYSPRGARNTVLNRVVPPLCAGLFVAWLITWKRRLSLRAGVLVSVLLALAAGTTGAVTYARLPRTEVRLMDRQAFLRISMHEKMASTLQLDLSENPQKADDLAWVQDRWQQVLKEFGMNEPATVDDSPGSAFLRQTNAGIEHVWYDELGAEHVIPLRASSTPSDTAPSTEPK